MANLDDLPHDPEIALKDVGPLWREKAHLIKCKNTFALSSSVFF